MREFYLKTISLHVNRSLDDLASFAMEKPILRHMKNMAHVSDSNHMFSLDFVFRVGHQVVDYLLLTM